MKENLEVQETQEVEMLDEVLSIYRNIHNALSVTVESIVQLGKLGLTDEHIMAINECKCKEVDELFTLVGEVDYFVEHKDEIFNELI